MRKTDHTRRRLLRGGIAAGSLFLPLPYAWVWAQSEGTIRLLKAPKLALVVGNGKYKDAPELRNAPNDARAIAETLKASGFAATMLLDTGRDALIGAIRDYVHAMEQKKAVGLFYFAGHGVQLDWRNYMLPVDAVIDRIEDVAKQSVDVARLMAGLTKAANPMNVIILDACRENPFGTAKQPAQKGLSQMDAPAHTLLAYATSPGNVASDGDGVNGLYTEHLLREMKVQEAKIEDVFKRVRLGVRRRSNGAQIPWESTSLEEDFWFLPPAQLKKISEDEKERIFREEAAFWEKIRNAAEPGPIEEYLRRYPSGNFTELAQLQLDRVLAKQGEKKIHVASQEGNPYTKGTAELNTNMNVGDTYTYRVVDLYTGLEQRTVTTSVVRVTDTEVVYNNGLVTDLMGNNRRLPDGRTLDANQNVPLEFAVGRKWSTRYTLTLPNGARAKAEVEFKVAARESITVPAGTLNAFRVEGNGWSTGIGPNPTQLALTQWWAPDMVRRPLASEDRRRAGPKVIAADRTELVSFKQG